jgi:hypothetical protein
MQSEPLSEPVQRREFLGAAGVIFGSSQISVDVLPNRQSPSPQVLVNIWRLESGGVCQAFWDQMFSSFEMKDTAGHFVVLGNL